MVKSKAILKQEFETGDTPTGENFVDLIDSLLHVQDVPEVTPNVVVLASQSEAQLGVENTKTMTSLRVRQSILRNVRLANIPELRDEINALLSNNTQPVAPLISSNPSPVIAGVQTVFSTTNTGTINWYIGGVFQSSGSTFTVANPTEGQSITAKKSVNGVLSLASTPIVVAAAPVVSNEKFLALSLVYPHESDTLSLIQTFADAGCNAIQMTVDYRMIHGFNPLPNAWGVYDAVYNKAKGLGMKVGVRIALDDACLKSAVTTGSENGVSICNGILNANRMKGQGLGGASDRLIYQNNAGPSATDSGQFEDRVLESLNSPAFTSKLSSFVDEVVRHYNQSQFIGSLAWMSVAISSTQELNYPTGTTKDNGGDYLFDYSDVMIGGFRIWLANKYATIADLNTAWGSSYASFGVVQAKLPSGGTFVSAFQGNDGKDWFNYRTKVLKDVNQQFYNIVKSINPNIKTVTEFGSVYDRLSAQRSGNIDFKTIVMTDGIKINDAPEYDSRFSMDLIRTAFPNKLIMNEVEFRLDKEQLCIQQMENCKNHKCGWLNLFQPRNFIAANKLSIVTDFANSYLNSGAVVVDNTKTATFNLSDTLNKGGVNFDDNGTYNDLNNTNAYAHWKALYTNKPINLVMVNDLASSVNTSQTELLEGETLIAEKLNQADMRGVADFDIPLHPNPKFPDQRVFENIVFGPYFRHQAVSGDVFKKGFTSIQWGIAKLGTERQNAPYQQSFVSAINIRKLSYSSGGPDYPVLNLQNGTTVQEVMDVDYGAYSQLTNNLKFNIPQVFNGSDTAFFDGRYVMLDFESGGLAALDGGQDFVNRCVALTQAIQDGVGPNTLFALDYQFQPLKNIGFGVLRSMYTGTADNSWTMPVSPTANSNAKNMPASLVGKRLKDYANGFIGVEVYFKAEAFLGEKVLLKNLNGTNLKDWGGNDLPLFSHFGAPQNVASLPNYKPSYLHFATHIAASLGLNRKHSGTNHLMLLRTSLFNYHYFFDDFGGGANTIIDLAAAGISRHAMPQYMAKAAVCIAFFSGAGFYNFDGFFEITEANRNLGEIQNANEFRRDYSGLANQAKMTEVLTTDIVAVGTSQHGVFDLIDGNEEYLYENVEVDYLTVAGFNTPKKINPCDWMEFELSPIMAIVNRPKNLIAIWGTIAYNGSQEPTQADVYYREHGYDFKKRITLANNKNSLYVFSLI
jgi:hypothetical protein